MWTTKTERKWPARCSPRSTSYAAYARRASKSTFKPASGALPDMRLQISVVAIFMISLKIQHVYLFSSLFEKILFNSSKKYIIIFFIYIVC
jgi:hypothetical protein